VLHHLAGVKRAIAASGPPGARRYRVMPIMPGIFEMVLIGEAPETLSPGIGGSPSCSKASTRRATSPTINRGTRGRRRSSASCRSARPSRRIRSRCRRTAWTWSWTGTPSSGSASASAG
jgi:hypothetical protein